MMFLSGLSLGILVGYFIAILTIKKLEKHGLEVEIKPRFIRTNGKHKPIPYSDKKAIEIENI